MTELFFEALDELVGLLLFPLILAAAAIVWVRDQWQRLT